MRIISGKFITILLIFNLFFVRGFSAMVVYGQDIAPTSVPAPTSPPSTPKPPSDPKSTSDPKPTVPMEPSKAPAPTSAPSAQSSVVQPTSPPASPTSVSETTPSPDSPGTSQDELSPTPDEEGSLGISPTGFQNEGSQNQTYGDNQESINDPANTNTGPYSQNTGIETLDQKMEVLNKNLAELQNKIDVITNTGFNYANLNTLDGQVFTGDTTATLNLLNKLNSNMTGIGGFAVYNIYDLKLGDLYFKFAKDSDSFASASTNVSKNSVTGPVSTNEAIADNSFTVKEAYGNDAKIDNDINLQAVSGNNTASNNTGNGIVQTGDASVLGNIVNLVNTNLNVSKWLFGVVNIFGTLAGNIILPQEDSSDTQNSSPPPSGVLVANDNTGAYSTNNATLNVNETANTTMNNTADIVSTLNVSANSGNNIASVNTGGGFVQSGQADATVSNSTIANSNTIEEEGTVWMVIVNKMGKWVGEIIGAPWGSTAASNSLPVVQSQGGMGVQSYSTTSQNTGTGPFSTNNATQNISSDTSIAMENSASISNNITANADTGDNKAEYNTGAGAIQSGDAKVGVNLVNMANTNVVAKKFVAILVNVLGEFLGDVVSPDQQPQELASANSYTPTVTVSPPTPTPTVYQLPQFNTVANNIGGLPLGGNYVQPAQVVNSAQENMETSYQAGMEEYQQAVTNAQNAKNQMVAKSKKLAQNFPGTYILGSQQAKVLKRGSFVSPAFAKAVEGSFPGILLGGAYTKINESWLSIIPVALFILYIRRRKKFNINFEKYLNALLEIVL